MFFIHWWSGVVFNYGAQLSSKGGYNIGLHISSNASRVKFPLTLLQSAQVINPLLSQHPEIVVTYLQA